MIRILKTRKLAVIQVIKIKKKLIIVMIRIYNKNKKIGCYFYVEFKNNNFLKPMIIKDILFTPLG